MADAERHAGVRDGSSPILPALAGLAVITGLFTIVAANWSGYSGVWRLTILFSLLAMATIGAGVLRARGSAVAPNIAATIGAGLVGIGLVVIGQLYHASATTSGFLALWTMLAAAVALLLRSPLAGAAVAALGAGWTQAHFFEFSVRDSFTYSVPFVVLAPWAAIAWQAADRRSLGLIHVVAIGAVLWIAYAVAGLLSDTNAKALAYAEIFALVFAAIAAVFEIITRTRPFWSSRTLAGWATWMASGSLASAAMIGRDDHLLLSRFDVGLLALTAFAGLTAYGAAPGRRWLRGAGVAGFIATSLTFFTAAQNLAVAGVMMIAFGAALTGLLIVTNKMIARARHDDASAMSSGEAQS